MGLTEDICGGKTCEVNEFIDIGFCLCVACNSCEKLVNPDRQNCFTACDTYFKSRQSVITDSPTTPTSITTPVIYDTSVNVASSELNEPSKLILIVITVVLALVVLVIFSCLILRKHHKSCLISKQSKDMEDFTDIMQQQTVQVNKKCSVATETDKKSIKTTKEANKPVSRQTGHTQNEGNLELGVLKDQTGKIKRNSGSESKSRLDNERSVSNTTEAVIEFTCDNTDSQTKDNSPEVDKQFGSRSVSSGLTKEIEKDTKSSPRPSFVMKSSHQEEQGRETTNCSPESSHLNSKLLENLTNVRLRQADPEAINELCEVLNERETPLEEDKTALDDSMTCIKGIHGQLEEETPLLQTGRQTSLEPQDTQTPTYSIKSVKDMPATTDGPSNKSLYQVLRGIPWVIGYFSQGNSIEVYIDFNEISPEEALNRLLRQSGAPAEKYHVKQNEFY